MIEKCRTECEEIRKDCKLNAEVHHILAARYKRYAFLFELIPALATAFFGGILINGSNSTGTIDYKTWALIISAIITAIGSISNPIANYYEHLRAAKHFVLLKHDARVLCELLSHKMSDDEFIERIKDLREKYRTLVLFVPPSDNRAFKKAKKNLLKNRKDNLKAKAVLTI